jgi:hypothetical protein
MTRTMRTILNVGSRPVPRAAAIPATKATAAPAMIK